VLFQVWGKGSGNYRSPNVHQHRAVGARLEMGQSQQQVCKSKWCSCKRRTAVVWYRASPQSLRSGFGRAAWCSAGPTRLGDTGTQDMTPGMSTLSPSTRDSRSCHHPGLRVARAGAALALPPTPPAYGILGRLP